MHLMIWIGWEVTLLRTLPDPCIWRWLFYMDRWFPKDIRERVWMEEEEKGESGMCEQCSKCPVAYPIISRHPRVRGSLPNKMNTFKGFRVTMLNLSKQVFWNKRNDNDAWCLIATSLLHPMCNTLSFIISCEDEWIPYKLSPSLIQRILPGFGCEMELGNSVLETPLHFYKGFSHTCTLHCA